MAALPRLAISKCLFVVVPEVLLIFATTFLPEEEDEETLASLRTPAMPLCDLPSVAFFTSFTALAPFDEDDDFFESDDIPLLDDVDAVAFPEEDSTPPRRSKPSKAAMRFVEARRIIFREIFSSSSSSSS